MSHSSPATQPYLRSLDDDHRVGLSMAQAEAPPEATSDGPPAGRQASPVVDGPRNGAAEILHKNAVSVSLPYGDRRERIVRGAKSVRIFQIPIKQGLGPGDGMDSDDAIAADVAACLDQIAAGDLSARDRVIELCSGRLRTLAHRMLARFPNVRRWDDTDDVFQNAAMRLHRTLGQMRLDSPRSVMALAATQLHRELIDLARRHAGPASYAANHGTNVMPSTEGTGAASRHVDRAAAPGTSVDRWTLFHEAIAALPDDQREVFQIVWYLGADQKSAATLIGCSERTVKSRWREAREAVKAALDGAAPE